eukprot:TRINITY_DN13203_c0_g1_i1.p1 TRINITY_DN13203_c0_g1~~TRINITY_DN13203_c0_g1_i1.p1  ORF type:complete len:299 (+),score=80.00 TRINITY_DN13203_c0_g1_i1:97-993(+)
MWNMFGGYTCPGRNCRDCCENNEDREKDRINVNVPALMQKSFDEKDSDPPPTGKAEDSSAGKILEVPLQTESTVESRSEPEPFQQAELAPREETASEQPEWEPEEEAPATRPLAAAAAEPAEACAAEQVAEAEVSAWRAVEPPVAPQQATEPCGTPAKVEVKPASPAAAKATAHSPSRRGTLYVRPKDCAPPSEAQQRKVNDWLERHGFDGIKSSRKRMKHVYFPLHLAVSEGDAEMVRLLCALGAQHTVLNSDGQTPVEVALELDRKGSHAEILTLLQQPGRVSPRSSSALRRRAMR